MIDKTWLMGGENFKTKSGVEFIHPKLELTKTIGAQNYFNFVGLFCTLPHEIMVELDDKGIDFESITQFDLFKESIKENYQYYSQLFPLFSNIKFVIPDLEDDRILYILNDGDENAYEFSIELFYEIVEFMRIIHCKEQSKPPKFKNNSVKQIYIELEREEKEFKTTTDFSKLISSLVWCKEGSYKYSEIWELNMFQFHEGVKTVTDQKDFETMINAVYAGTIDSKKINKNRLNWIRS